MSAFVCSEEHFARLANAIKRNDDFRYLFQMDENKVLEFINTLIKANFYAVNNKYEERKRGYKLNSSDLSKYEVIHDNSCQVLKLIHCLQYQCGEGDTEKKFRKVFELLRKVECGVASDIVDELPEYKDATWGP